MSKHTAEPKKKFEDIRLPEINARIAAKGMRCEPEWGNNFCENINMYMCGTPSSTLRRVLWSCADPPRDGSAGNKLLKAAHAEMKAQLVGLTARLDALLAKEHISLGHATATLPRPTLGPRGPRHREVVQAVAERSSASRQAAGAGGRRQADG